MKHLLLILLVSLNTHSSFCQGLDAQWLKGIPVDSSFNELRIRDVVHDHNQNGFVFGGFEKSIVLGPGVVLNPENSILPFVVAKYSNAGNFLWARTIKGPNGEKVATGAIEASVDGQGNIVVAGNFLSSQVSFEGGNTLTRSCNTSDCAEAFIVKYGSSGNFLWAKKPVVSNNASFRFNALATDASGNVYAAGYFESTQVNFGNGVTLSTSLNNNEFIVKYKSDGTAEWAKTYPGNDVYIESLKVSSDNHLVACGRYWNTLELGNGIVLDEPDPWGGFVAKLSPSGSAIGALPWESDRMEAYGLELDGNGHAYILGICDSEIRYVNGSAFYSNPNGSTPRQFLMKISNTFKVGWVKILGFGREITLDYSIIDDNHILFPCAEGDFDGFTAVENSCGSTGFMYRLNTSDGIANALYRVEGDACNNLLRLSYHSGSLHLWGRYWLGSINLGSQSLSSPTGGGYFISRVTLGTVGLSDAPAEASGTVVVPNPNSGSFVLQFQDAVPDEISVVDPAGRLVLNRKPSGALTERVDIGDQPKGLYFLQARYGNVVSVSKMIVE